MTALGWQVEGSHLHLKQDEAGDDEVDEAEAPACYTRWKVCDGHRLTLMLTRQGRAQPPDFEEIGWPILVCITTVGVNLHWVQDVENTRECTLAATDLGDSVIVRKKAKQIGAKFLYIKAEFVFKTQSEIVCVIKQNKAKTKTREVHASIQTIIKVSRNEDKM